MKKGISPIVAVVLLIAIAVIAAVGLYFWVGGLATKQPTPNTPKVITAICTGGTVTVSNTGTQAIAETLSWADGTTTGITTLAVGETKVATGAPSTSGSIYGATTGAAQYNC